MRLRTDLVDVLEAVIDDRLETLPEGLEWIAPAVCVVMAAKVIRANTSAACRF